MEKQVDTAIAYTTENVQTDNNGVRTSDICWCIQIYVNLFW